MATIGFLTHPERPAAAELAADLVGWLIDRGHEVRLRRPDANRIGRPELGHSDPDIAVGADLVVGLGGDGTMMRAVDLAAEEDVAVLGVNVGQLGYLTTVEPLNARAALKRFLSGACSIEQRMRVEVSVRRSDGTVEDMGRALNEALIERADLGHTVRLDVSLDGDPFTPYVADGVIVATPTGSTAYAFSARGPIIDPSHRALLLVPVAPHMLFDRALVLDPSTTVQMDVCGPRSAHLSLDGRDGGEIAAGDRVEVRVAARSARIVSLGPPSFHQVLKSKFGLPDR